ncbi:MAG: type II toxin-antitoxin system RelB/DinJ family antitoxin [Lachnospiraceae bacterium]|nr:type II toxin-antitoxin system RelB/DinJ family antitoxin [Lachnospiraceae bacterium]
MVNSLVQFRIDEKIKNDASEVYERLGLDLSSAIKLFLKKTIRLNALPFDINSDEIDESELRQKKALALQELDKMGFSFSHDIKEKDEIYNALMEKYESIN